MAEEVEAQASRSAQVAVEPVAISLRKKRVVLFPSVLPDVPLGTLTVLLPNHPHTYGSGA
jgi:hypothetical protein